MKKLFSTLLLLFTLSSSLFATTPETTEIVSDTRYNGRMGLGIDLISHKGFGVSLGAELAKWVHVRAGYNFFPFVVDSYNGAPISIEIPGVSGSPAFSTNIAANMNWHTGSLMFDLFPSKKSNFHFTVGFFGGTRDLINITNTTRLPEQYDNAGFTYYVDGDKSDLSKMYRINSRDGYLNFSLGKNWTIRPYVGLGWGSIVPKKRVGVIFDMGVEYTGGTGIFTYGKHLTRGWERINLGGEGLKTFYSEITGSEIDASTGSLLSVLDVFYKKVPILPYMKLTLVIKLF